MNGKNFPIFGNNTRIGYILEFCFRFANKIYIVECMPCEKPCYIVMYVIPSSCILLYSCQNVVRLFFFFKLCWYFYELFCSYVREFCIHFLFVEDMRSCNTFKKSIFYQFHQRKL